MLSHQASLGSTITATTMVACADVNGDGKNDAVLNIPGASTAVVYLGDGAGNFSNSKSSAVAIAPVSVGVALIDNDTQPDAFFTDGSGSLVTASGDGTGSLGTGRTYTVGAGASNAAAGDLNGDKLVDIVTADTSANTITVMLNSSSGVLTSHGTIALPGSPIQVLLNDFNGDGKLDAVALSPGANAVYVALGKGDGTFVAPTTNVIIPSSTATTLGDFNGDGHVDIVTSFGSAGLSGGSVLLGRGDGTFFNIISTSVDARPRFVVTGDVDQDGALDLVVVNYQAQTMQVLKNPNNKGQLVVAATYTPTDRPSTVALHDLDGDGFPDVIVGQDVTAGGLDVFINNRDGTFPSTPKHLPAGTFTWGIGVADLNGDQRPDLVTANRDSNTIAVLIQQASGSFAAPVLYPVGNANTTTSPAEIALGDVNGDGIIDILAPLFSTPGALAALIGVGDGTFNASANLQPVLTSGQSFGTAGGVATADFNLDGIADVALASADSTTAAFIGSTSGLKPQSAIFGIGEWFEIYATDVTSDGIPDMVMPATGQNAFAVYPGNGDGTFATPVWYGGGVHTYGMAFADFNGDGLQDFVEASMDSGIVSVHLNGGCP